MVNTCPMCLKDYTALNQHLLVTHKAWNKDERELLVKLAGGKISVRLHKCPVPSCVQGTFTRLDRHMNTHKELSAASKDKLLKVVRKRLMLDTLAGLRATNPTVPMVSRLDLDQAEGLEWDKEEEEEEEEEGEEGEEGEGLVAKLKRTIVSMNDALQVAHGYNRTLKRSYVALQRKYVKLQKQMQIFGPAEPPALQTSEAGPFYSCRSTEFPDLNVLLECFKKMQEGPDPSPKLLNNVQSKLNRIRTFVGWMIRDKTQLGRLQFLCDVDRLREWVKSLRGSKLALSTTLNYLKNVRQFLRFIQEMPPPSSSINKNDLKRVIKELTASIKSWNRPVVLHQLRVKEKKDAALHSIKDLQECRRLALVAIPKVISKLEKHHTTTDRNKLFGLVLAYLASLYGHQAGVFLNLTDEQVSKAVYGPKENDYLIKVEEQKTNESFGTATMLLTDQEYGWLSFIISLKKKWAKGGEEVSKFLFFNTTFSQDMNLNNYLKSAWSNMQLSGEATFTSLRSAVETFARDRHGEHSQKWKKMARLMCHDTKTSDTYYTMEQTRKGRQLFEEAQEEEEEGAEGEEDKDEEEEGGEDDKDEEEEGGEEDKDEEEGEEDKDDGEERRTKRRRER
ncbi:uncharacterized protein LOC117552651 isoform X2 [Gymnodraco acuticeps]|uniref:Uncharacterized protein LOC117552651 isoform X2 n=1 Tax=Gymnodraco acuticeps TaxID=8218 RepID=A0A6P8V912_GYMAC|nr:uncharacterized protein LOC117552651 isoform X2 [Gymnodraco acuticeps]